MSPASNWGPQASASSGTETPVSVLLAGEVGQRLLTWQQAVTMDARFRVAALANDPSDLQAKLAYSPEVIIMDAMIFKGPQLLTQALTSITGAVYVILPGSISTATDPEVKELPEKLKAIPSVKQVFIGDAPIPDLLQRAYGDALALRRTIAAPMSWATRNQGMTSVSGLRVIAVWNRIFQPGRAHHAAAGRARRGSQAHRYTGLVGLLVPGQKVGIVASVPVQSNTTQGTFSKATIEGLRCCISIHVLQLPTPLPCNQPALQLPGGHHRRRRHKHRACPAGLCRIGSPNQFANRRV